ncbi:ATPase family AAA domain-containing protein 2-like isoform X1 [Alosa sapidissima]|uniref:ATPase family AAA domain-containing protein 2-like isoform X1 n=2 Tax=Alosa sapidissima TaxID=34773 RepID=UPI001C083E87|nr:ATPase family AAA domain-containing protein 2-like isoform X1 [Alosa sapidissima]XP_041931934.1 ATPase family AAA domain-containing protein 2-like isoform X1 [Alosa sapidissima]
MTRNGKGGSNDRTGGNKRDAPTPVRRVARTLVSPIKFTNKDKDSLQRLEKIKKIHDQIRESESETSHDESDDYDEEEDGVQNNTPAHYLDGAGRRMGSYRVAAAVPRSINTTSRRIGRNQHKRPAGNDSSSSDEDDMDRCLPLNFRKEDLAGLPKDRMKPGASLADVDPVQVDQSIGFDAVGGLTSHIAALKEMVVFPLLYPEVFDKFKIESPKGCLFYGPPGTGKTLVARALANECSHGDRRVAFFMRKGADCLSKWVGESERHLRLLFDQAYQMRPSIIFFDEIDGLAPVRSSRQDQIHSSIVSTLLALMDGLDSRGEVVVIGATNRLDAIDPALRRPGRFDREFLFGLPDREARKDILKIYTKQWKPTPSDAFLEELADKCVGYCGADIKAVCVEAALCALRRRYPQIYHSSEKLVLDISSITISSCDFVAAMRKLVPASQRSMTSPGKALTPTVQPLLASALSDVLETLQMLFPHTEQGLKKKKDADLTTAILDDDLLYADDEGTSSGAIYRKTPDKGSFLQTMRSAALHPTSHRPRLLLSGRPGSGQTTHLSPSVLHALEKFTVYTLDMASLFGDCTTSAEQACCQIFCEAKRTVPSILYMPLIEQCWDTVSSVFRTTFLSLLQNIPPFSPILLLATTNLPHNKLDTQIQKLFKEELGEVYCLSPPSSQERRKFFEDLILCQAAKAPAAKREALLQAIEVLPIAPPPPPRQMSEKERQRLEQQEEDTLRELRLFLRSVNDRLMQDRRFKAFTKPVDKEQVPDYHSVVKQPMDLSTALSKIDQQKYTTVREYLHDIDLIWKNALEYNPEDDPYDRQIRHRACALKDTVHAIIKYELEKDFERTCEQIKEAREKRGHGRVPNNQDNFAVPNSPKAKQKRKMKGELEEPEVGKRGRMTRTTKTLLAQQHQLIDVDKALEFLAKKTPQLVVNHDGLKDLLKSVVMKTEGFEVFQLEKVYALLSQCIYRHRKEYNKTELIKEMKREIESLS